MRLLYEINADLAALLEQVDEETGELTCNLEDLEKLSLERDKALEGIALSIINQRAEMVDIVTEITRLQDRRAQAQKRLDRYTELLTEALGGEKMKTPLVSVSYRRSTRTEIEEGKTWRDFPEAYLRRKDPEINRDAIKASIKAGFTVPGAKLVESISTIVK